MRLVSVCAIVALLATGSAGAAGASRQASATSPKVWSTQVCGSLLSWERSLTTQSNRFAKTIDATHLVHARAQFVSFLRDITARTAVLVKAIDAAGTPSIQNGAHIEALFHRQLSQLRNGLKADIAAARGLSTTNPAKFAAKAAVLGKAIDRQGAAVSKAFSTAEKRYPAPALDRLWNTIAVCRTSSK